MKKEDKVKIFKPELDLIKDLDTRLFTEKCIENLPDYIFKIPASSTGKYHPKFTLGEGGLVRHIKFAVNIANECLRLDMFKCYESKQPYIIAAIILHDGLKKGNPEMKFTVHDHPLLVSEFIMELAKTDEEEKIAKEICPLIETHMGQWTNGFFKKDEKKWNTSTGQKVILPSIGTKIQGFVHLCDCLASRKFYDNFYPEVIDCD